MNWLKLIATIVLSAAEAIPQMNHYRPVINMADVARGIDIGNVIRDYRPPNEMPGRKVPCGPNPLPGENCEQVTVCGPASYENRKSYGESLHDKLRTTCVPVKKKLRHRCSGMQGYLRQEYCDDYCDDYYCDDDPTTTTYYQTTTTCRRRPTTNYQSTTTCRRRTTTTTCRRRPTTSYQTTSTCRTRRTTSTYPPYSTGGLSTTSRRPEARCDQVANCREHLWK